MTSPSSRGLSLKAGFLRVEEAVVIVDARGRAAKIGQTGAVTIAACKPSPPNAEISPIEISLGIGPKRDGMKREAEAFLHTASTETPEAVSLKALSAVTSAMAHCFSLHYCTGETRLSLLQRFVTRLEGGVEDFSAFVCIERADRKEIVTLYQFSKAVEGLLEACLKSGLTIDEIP